MALGFLGGHSKGLKDHFPLSTFGLTFPPINSRHLDCVRAVAFHPTELILATGSEDNVVKVWRLPSSTLDPSKCVLSKISLAVWR